ncbi:MAG: Hpt domain-containing protein [Gammaproteobacteria bacterium]|nr:Hpt domain-containing protein [Gammaproteobacteria bacterium]
MTSINSSDLSVLDLDILTQYTQAIGGQALLGSVDIFEQQFPLYIDNLVACLQCGDIKGLTEEAHKMKGAAGAVGLFRLGALSNKLQNSNHVDWAQCHLDYIKGIKLYLKSDVDSLREYLLSC